jgi:hypothetical protein
VAFLPATGANQIGWVPLAPGEQYAPAYYDSNWQPHYVGDNYAAPERVVNLSVPGGLTVVSVEDFGRPVGRNSIARFDPRAFEGTRPVLEPFSNALLRQASLQHAHANERRGFALPPGLAKKLDATRVYASAPPTRDGDERARRFKVEQVPEQQKREKLKLNDGRQQPLQVAAPARGFESRGRARGNRGNEQAEQRAARGRDFGNSGPRPVSPESPQAERVAARAEERARGERASQARQQAAREQQRAAAQQQQRFEARRQAEANAQAQRQAAQQQRAQQAAAQRAQQQQEVMRARQVQQQQERHAERSQAPGQARHQQQAPAGGPPSGGGGRGQGQGQGHGGGGKGKGKP